MIFPLLPLSWEELVSADPFDIQVVGKRLLQDFYPEFQVQPDLNTKFWHSSYLSTYIKRDLRALRNIHGLTRLCHL